MGSCCGKPEDPNIKQNQKAYSNQNVYYEQPPPAYSVQPPVVQPRQVIQQQPIIQQPIIQQQPVYIAQPPQTIITTPMVGYGGYNYGYGYGYGMNGVGTGLGVGLGING
jgi:hypothetical protein